MDVKAVLVCALAVVSTTAAIFEIVVINRLEQQEALEAAILAGNNDVDVFVGVYRIGCEPKKPGYINAWEREADVSGGQIWLKPLLTRSIRAVVCDGSNAPKQDDP